MTKQEFLDELKSALAGEVPANVVMDSYSYYADYIDSEVRKGRSEESILDELGKPSLIARSIIAAQTGEREADYEYTEDGRTRTIRNEKSFRRAERKNAKRTEGVSNHSEISFNFSGLFAKVALFLIFFVLCIVAFFIIKLGLWVLLTFGIPILLILGIIYLIIAFTGQK